MVNARVVLRGWPVVPDKFPDPLPRNAAAELRNYVLGRWGQDGTLITGPELAQAWGVGSESLAGLTAVTVNGKAYYPGIWRERDPGEVRQICDELARVEPDEQIIFWLRQHGGLGGATVIQGLRDGRLGHVLAIAQAWADEHSRP